MLFELGLGRSQRDVGPRDLLDRKQRHPQLLSIGFDAEGRRVDFHHRVPDLMDGAELLMVGAEDVAALQVAQVIILRLGVAGAPTDEGPHRLCHVGVLTLLKHA